MRTPKQIIKLLNHVKNWQVALLIVVFGVLTFSSGLNGGFQGDDFDQIVDNKAIHSLSNIGQFFSSGTFWNGESLSGDFYRPMMSLTFSIVYNFFGANPVAFHVVQLILYLAGAFVLYLFLKTLIRPAPALLAIMLLAVHPINTQIIYSIPCMQEPLFFLPGITALYVLSRYKSVRSLVLATGLLFLSLLAKETAIVFVMLAIAYMFIYRKKQAWMFVKIIVAPIVLYFLIRSSVVGHTSLQHISPISDLDLTGRILTIPSLIVFYFSTFFWPQQLATNYYWTEPNFTINGVLLPLLIVMAIAAIFVAGAWFVNKKGTKQQFINYLFFAGWIILGLGPHMQLIQLDMTACETWFYIAQVGVIGTIAVFLSVLLKKMHPKYLILLIIPYLIVLLALAGRSFMRGFDYASQTTISTADIAVNENNYFALNNLARMEIKANNLDKARDYAQRSIDVYPAVSNYNNLGVINQKQGKINEARKDYEASLKYGTSVATYTNLAIIYSSTETSENTIKMLQSALAIYPKNTTLLTFLAMHQAALGQRSDAIKTLNQVYYLGGQIPYELAVAVQTGSSLDIPVSGTKTVIHIPAVTIKNNK